MTALPRELPRLPDAGATLEAELRLALQRGELSLHYQPILGLAEGRPVAAEALLRWSHPRRGAVPPDTFVPLAESGGLIAPIGAWALRQAMADAVRWPAPLRVAVNLSAAQFATEPLLGTVTAALDATGLPPARLELEVTESCLLRPDAVVVGTLGALRRMGVRLALDDFGTRYASFRYLRDFAFDKIKIDGSFVREMETRRDSAAIVRAMAGLAAELGLDATAEGVETAGQLAGVRAAGCTQAQGFHLAGPMPAASLAAWLARA